MHRLDIVLYLAHPVFLKDEVRAWEIEAEKRLGILFFNPFFDKEDKGIKMIDDDKTGKLLYDRSSLPSNEIVPPDLCIINNCNGLIGIFTDKPSAGTPMEFFYSAHDKRFPTFAMTKEKFISPWMKYFCYEGNVARSYEELEAQIKGFL